MKNNVSPAGLLLVFSVMLASCDQNGINGIFSRAESVSDVVVAESLNEGRNIFLKWNADLGADSYIISRSVDGVKGIDEFLQVYTGTETNYIDQNIDVNLSYAYRLDKKRGNAIYEGKDLTFFARTRNDPFFDEVTIERLNGDTELYLEWLPDPGADSYILAKSKETTTGLDEFMDVYHGLATSYSDKAISDAMVYVYRLDKMRDGTRIEGEGVTVFSRYAPTPDKISLEIIGAGGEVRLSWDLDANADSYIIRKQSVDVLGNLTDLDPITTEQITYMDKDVAIDMMYIYRLDKVRGGVTYGGVETTSYSRIRDVPFFDVIVATAVGNNVRLSWLKDPNADSYIIQKESIDEFGVRVVFEPITTQQISYLDSEVAIDMTYVYRLDKVRGSITYKGIETSIYSLMRDTPFSDIIVASYLGDKALLSWKHDANADSYLIQKQSIDTNNNIVDLLPISTDKTSYIDSAVAKDMIYIYRLDKIRGGTTYEGISLTTFSTTRPDPFPGVIVAESLSDGKAAHLSWEPDIGADAYRVMRSLNNINLGQFEWIPQTSLEMLSDVSAIDTGIDDDKSYVYRLDKYRNGITSWFIGNQVTVFSWNRPPPFDEAPVVDSFRSDKTIKISWNTDIGADIYKLERRENNFSGWLSWESIYQGTALTYIDTTAYFENYAYTRYEYRLTKIRNGIEYVPQYDTTLAVAVETEKDLCEPNDDYLNATLLNISITNNIYCFKFTGDRVLEDRDWYKVSVPAGKTAVCDLYYTQAGNSGMLKVYEPSKLEASITDGGEIKIKNDDTVQKFIYFAILPDRDKFSTGLGGQMITYTINWQAITN